MTLHTNFFVQGVVYKVVYKVGLMTNGHIERERYMHIYICERAINFDTPPGRGHGEAGGVTVGTNGIGTSRGAASACHPKARPHAAMRAYHG